LILSKNNWVSRADIARFLIIFCLACSSCAKRPWTEPLNEKQTENVTQFLQLHSFETESCAKSIDGDISLSYQNLFDRENVSGYFQILAPSYIKFIVSNPLGQPVLALTSNQDTFQLINTFTKTYITGSVYSYGLHKNIPLALVKGNWKDWIMGTMNVDPAIITNIREDRDDRGVWVTVAENTEKKSRTTHLLVDTRQGILLSRIVESNKGEILATITYKNWVSVGNCQQPQTILVTGLEFGTEMTIKLSDVRIAEDLDKNDFLLTKPAGYLMQFIH